MAERKHLCDNCHGAGCVGCSWTGYLYVQKENEVFGAFDFAFKALTGQSPTKKCILCDDTGIVSSPDTPNVKFDCPRGCKKQVPTKQLR